MPSPRQADPTALETRADTFACWAFARSLDRAASPDGIAARLFLRAAHRGGYQFTAEDYANHAPGRCSRWLALWDFAESVRRNECDTRHGR